MSNNLLDTKTVNLTEIIWNWKKYQVPSFQRDYSWWEWEWEDLWLDMIDVYEDKITHYMWAIVLQKKEEDIFYLIDWQQRITTLSIFIIALIEYLEYLSKSWIDVEENMEMAKIIRRNFISDKDAVSLKYSSKLFLNENNNPFYQWYLVNFNTPVWRLSDSQKLIWESYEYFYKKIEEYFIEKKGEKISEFLNKNIAKNLMFIMITVEDELSAYTVFETLNSRWVELTTTDLLKNFLFSQVSRYPVDFEIVKNHWSDIISIVWLKDFPTFLRYYINSKYKLISQKQLFKFIKKQILEKKDVIWLLLELKENSIIYMALWNPQDDEWKKYSEYKKIEKYIWELKLFWIKLAKSLLLAWYNNFSDKDFVKLLKMTSIISFRYNVIWNKNPKEMEVEYNKISQKIASWEIKDTKNVFDFIKNKLYISDNEFKDLFRNKEIKISKRKLLKYILVNIDNNLSWEKNDYNSDNWTIEHILPQNPDISWDEEFPENIRESFTSRLWNYLLLESNLNKEAENKNFLEKTEIYSKSKYIVSKDFKNHYSESWWNTATIDKFQNYYADIAKNIWKLDY